MKRTHLFAAAAVFALAACGQSATKEEEAPAATDLMGQVLAMPAEERPVFASTQLVAYHQAHPEITPPCTTIRRVDAVGVIPADVRPDTIYGPLAGSLVYTVQCGEILTTVGDDPRQHWMVVLSPGAAEAAISNCSDEEGRRSRCMRVPLKITAEAPATAPATPAPATP